MSLMSVCVKHLALTAVTNKSRTCIEQLGPSLELLFSEFRVPSHGACGLVRRDAVTAQKLQPLHWRDQLNPDLSKVLATLKVVHPTRTGTR